MSGSRHKGINSATIRKEIAVYNAEEKRTLAVLNYEKKFLENIK